MNFVQQIFTIYTKPPFIINVLDNNMFYSFCFFYKIKKPENSHEFSGKLLSCYIISLQAYIMTEAVTIPAVSVLIILLPKVTI